MKIVDKVIVITGASDGIGKVAAIELSRQGAKVIVVGRSKGKTKQVAKQISAPYFVADFAKLSDVRMLAKNINKQIPKIDVLINNAGGVFGDRQLTIDGNEMTFQINHLAPFLLTNLLIEKLIKSQAVIINTSSQANLRFGDLDLNDLNLTKGYTPNRAYGNSKLANILFTQELQRRYGNKGVTTVAVHPGKIATNFANNSTSWMKYFYRTPLSRVFLQTADEGAELLIWLASSRPGKDWQPGQYYDRFKIGQVNPQANKEISRKLWGISEKFTKT